MQSEILHIITLFSNGNKDKNTVVDAAESLTGDGIILKNFVDNHELLTFLQQSDAEIREHCAVLVFEFVNERKILTSISDIVQAHIPYVKRLAVLNKEDSCSCIEYNSELHIDRYLFYPFSGDRVRQQVEELIEEFLESQILRRSLQETRDTYEAMKSQLLAIQEANLRLDKKIMELSTLSEVGRDLIATRNVREILRKAALNLMGQKGASSVVVFLRDEHQPFLTIRYSKGIAPEIINSFKALPLKSTIVNLLFQTGRALFLDELNCDGLCEEDLELLFQLNCQMVIPLLNKDERKGFILIGTKVTDMTYSDDDFEFFTILANQITFALENAQLYAALEAKIVELESANRELRELDRMKSEFITIASHELRTPLTAVRGYAELLLAGKFASLSPSQQRAVEVMNKNIDRLIDISDDVVQLSKIDADRLSINLVPKAIDSLIEEIIEDSLPFAQSRDITLQAMISNDCPIVLIDHALFSQAVTELIKNAIRFTADGGKIVLRAKKAEERDLPQDKLPPVRTQAFLLVEVEDNGIGIPESEFEHIFERFYEIQHSNYHHSGTYGFKSGSTGLGLAIVKGIIEKHGGEIWVTSSTDLNNHGSTFTFVLPAPIFQ